jgi:hypothetical protein
MEWNKNKIIVRVSHFNYLGCQVYKYDADLQTKLNKFQYMCRNIKRTLTNKARKDTLPKFLQSYGCTNASVWMWNLGIEKKW